MSDDLEGIRAAFRDALATARADSISKKLTRDEAVVLADQKFGWLKDVVEALRQDAATVLETEVYATTGYAEFDEPNSKLQGIISLYEQSKPSIVLVFTVQGGRIQFESPLFQSAGHPSGTYESAERDALTAKIAAVFKQHLASN
jgi:hypothetical protein